jgi:uncharacterized repeat protein (TIGR01451 family)
MSSAFAQTFEVVSIVPSVTSTLTGTDYVYYLNYRCTGATGSCAGQTITAVLPTELTNVSLFSDANITSSNFAPGAGGLGGTATWVVGAMSTGITRQLAFSTKIVNGTTPAGTVINFTANGTPANPVTALTDPKLTVYKSGSSSIIENGTVLYNMSVVNATNNGNPNLGGVTQTNVTFTDIIPTNAVIVAWTVPAGYPAPTISGSNVVFNMGTMTAGQGIPLSITLQYPAAFYPQGSSATNTVSATSNPLGSPQITSNTATATTNVQAPNCDIRIEPRGDQTSPSVTAGVNPYSNYGWGNRVAYQMGNYSNVPAFMDMTHTIPLSFYPKRFDIYNNSGTGQVNFYYKTNLNSTWTAWATNPFTNPYGAIFIEVTSLGLGINEYLTEVRVASNGTYPPTGGIIWGYHYDFSGTDRNGSPASGPITLRAASAGSCATGGFPGGGGGGGFGGTPTTYTPFTSVVNVTPRHTEASIEKYVDIPAVTPGSMVTYKMRWDFNETSSNAPPVNPIFSDLLPLGMEYVAGSSTNGSGGALPITETVTLNYQGTGRTLVRWKFIGVFGQYAHNGQDVILFKARVRPGTPIGVQSNIYNVSTDETEGDIISTTPAKNIVDAMDLDGDGSTTDIIAQSYVADVNVLQLASLESYKWVKGSLDATETRHPAVGNTTAGGTANYRLVVRNLGNVVMKDIKVIDILPFINDVAVINGASRLSAWRPFLTSAVTVSPANPNVTTYYSLQQNPCRPEVYNSAGCTNDWTTTVPTDLATVQALKFDFGTTLMQGADSIVLSWTMRVPLDAPTGGQIAWNSFAFASTRNDNNDILAPSEPVKVGIAAMPAPLTVGSIGNYVWFDTNNDNIQNEPASAGINDVDVYLYNNLGAEIDHTVTSNNGGNAGYYLFPNLPAGIYTVGFGAVAGKVRVTQTTNTADGSDADASTGITPSITLAAGQNITDIDAGYKTACAPVCIPITVTKTK